MAKAADETIRARVWGTKNIYIHNDLSNIASYYHKLIKHRFSKDDNIGINFDRISCLIFLSFSFEAYLNFFGLRLVPDWSKENMERQPFGKKTKLIFETLKLSYEWMKLPFKSVDDLKNFRNTIAHGKPIIKNYDDVLELAGDDLDPRHELTAEWEALCSQESTLEIYENVDTVIHLMREASGITAFEMMTTSFGSMELAK